MTGEERFLSGGKELDFDMADFWQSPLEQVNQQPPTRSSVGGCFVYVLE